MRIQAALISLLILGAMSFLPHLLPRVLAQQQAIVFQSNWDTESGFSPQAVTDGGRWPKYWEFNHGTNS